MRFAAGADLVAGQFARAAKGAHVRDALEAIFGTATLATGCSGSRASTLRHAGFDLAEALVDHQFVARGMVMRAQTARRPSRRHVTFPTIRSPPARSTRAGRAQREMLRDAGYDDEAISELISSGVVRVPAQT